MRMGRAKVLGNDMEMGYRSSGQWSETIGHSVKLSGDWSVTSEGMWNMDADVPISDTDVCALGGVMMPCPYSTALISWFRYITCLEQWYFFYTQKICKWPLIGQYIRRC